MMRRRRKLGLTINPIKDEKNRTMICVVALLSSTLLLLCFLSTDVKIAGSLECEGEGLISKGNNETGEIKLQELTNIHCSGSFDTEMPLIVGIIFGGGQ